MAGHLDGAGDGPSGQGSGLGPQSCLIAVRMAHSLWPGAGSMRVTPAFPAPLGRPPCNDKGSFPITLGPHFLKARPHLPHHLGKLPAPGGLLPSTLPTQVNGIHVVWVQTASSPTLEGREEELAACPVAASMPGLRGLEAVAVDSVDPCCLNPEGQITGRPWTQGDKGDGVIKGLLTQ